MSPVSRPRKSKKAKNSKRGSAGWAAVSRGAEQTLFGGALLPEQRSALAAVAQGLGHDQQEADWYAESSARVLDEAGVLLGAVGPRELEDATAALLGAQLFERVHGDGGGLWFGAWFEQLAQAAAEQVRAGLEGTGGAWEAPWRLLHGMASIGTPDLCAVTLRAMNRVQKQVRRTTQPPEWLRLLPKPTATGELQLLRDPHLPRMGVLAEFAYPGGADRHVYLWDVDACEGSCLAGGGSHEDFAQAAAAWRSAVGETAGHCAPYVPDQADLQCLVQLDLGEEMLRGTENRERLDEWYRANRRLYELDRALRKRGQALPLRRSLYVDVETRWAEEAFAEWYAERNDGRRPDAEGAAALAEEWLEGALPGTELQPSPHRVQSQYALIHDWRPDHPVTASAHALFPDWVRFLAERGGYPEALAERAATTATTGERTPADCPIDDFSGLGEAPGGARSAE
ncbi:hypothetical protein ACFY3J_37525 [Streptomyces sp. NPDC001231]|uniref:hypothetical protein n=1 Tax=Streptomyces sp. NPDC001231 TaxID=3364549 RepID=UPI0036B47A0B